MPLLPTTAADATPSEPTDPHASHRYRTARPPRKGGREPDHGLPPRARLPEPTAD
ncbi:uncharacterized protein TRAVEDRAFT_27467 [Trametes versicolor FP-101664 SS1]|uniref:uncharacterized protein n=1 Tax=Trametes versicolor (strain FP-101664) TaxID=717944 RepID=UPI00046246C9|nr:uncharacterized protein TRAVEDRAFT_27467 [Trametes versicolor FP-101664 SS1]EIW62084.1 hypothetical protein TRAVEDRAFT_27467 [Trametes versicolor FP-101664 SS1]